MIKKTKIILAFTLLFLIGINNVSAKSLDCSETLKKKSSGSNVMILQSMLNKTTSCGLTVDGSFGDKTYNCVIKFQKNNNLKEDGIVGKSTCKKINSIYNKNVKPVVVVTASELNVRKGPSANYSKISTVERGAVLEYYLTKYIAGVTWYKIKINGEYGYVSGKYVSNKVILVDISDQTLVYYKDGKEKLFTSVVTGTEGSHDTPTGKYVLKKANKQKDRILRGTNDNGSKYSSHVDYWMPFILSRGIGFHDASWRSQFGGTIYKTNGSHGCVNMPSDMALELYNSITSDIDVVVRD